MTAIPTTPLIELRQLHKSFAGRPVLDVEHFAVTAGEALLLVGRNGAGKSTLLRILAGLESADGGEFRLHGQRLPHNPQKALSGTVIYLHQQPYLFDTSVSRNVAYGLRAAGVSGSEQEARVQQALEWSGLAHLAERHARTLSGGEKQRIALARAWVLRPALLLLDEPTANMDGEAREQTYFLVRRLVNEGMTVILTSHSLKADHPMLSRSLLLEAGQLKPLANTVKVGLHPPAAREVAQQLGRQQY